MSSLSRLFKLLLPIFLGGTIVYLHQNWPINISLPTNFSFVIGSNNEVKQKNEIHPIAPPQNQPVAQSTPQPETQPKPEIKESPITKPEPVGSIESEPEEINPPVKKPNRVRAHYANYTPAYDDDNEEYTEPVYQPIKPTRSCNTYVSNEVQQPKVESYERTYTENGVRVRVRVSSSMASSSSSTSTSSSSSRSSVIIIKRP